MATETDPAKRAVYDGRQLALKISANSVYGFTGAQQGKLPCMEIAGGVTSYGRQMLELTQKTVEEHYSTGNGCTTDAQVIYGDTDSIMVNFHVTEVEEAIKLGKEAATLVTKHFPPPVNLEFEKVYFPYLLISKKRYAGLLWVNSDQSVKIDTKGIETVRRDNCPLVKHVISTCLDKILIQRDVDSAVNFTKAIVSNLLQNKLDLSMLVISKALSKEGKEYAAKQAHVELARRMHERDPLTAPTIGDRVPYVITMGGKGSRAYEKAEDPLYVLEHSVPVDYHYYIEQQLKKPLTRVFKSILSDPNSLLKGEHTRTITVTTPSTQSRGIVGFAQRTARCLGCRSPLSKGQQTLCEHCKPRERELYLRQLKTVNEMENRFCRVWTQCQHCMDSLHQEILCMNRDCPIFYMRTKVKKDVQEAQNMLQRFDISDW